MVIIAIAFKSQSDYYWVSDRISDYYNALYFDLPASKAK